MVETLKVDSIKLAIESLVLVLVLDLDLEFSMRSLDDFSTPDSR